MTIDPKTTQAVSSTADFYPSDEDAPEGFITWTFLVPKEASVAAGVFELRFLRRLTPEEIETRAYDLTRISESAQ